MYSLSVNHCNKRTTVHADGNDTAYDGNATTLKVLLMVMTIEKKQVMVMT